MNRRDFIKSTIVTGVVVSAGARPQAEQKPTVTPASLQQIELKHMHDINLMHEAAEGHKRCIAELDAVREFVKLRMKGTTLP